MGSRLLSRTQTVKRLINIRKAIQKNEKELNQVELNEIKDEVDQLLVDVIGAPEKLQYKVNEVLTKAINEEIKIDTALVAIYELVNEGLDPVKMKKKRDTQKGNSEDSGEKRYSRNKPKSSLHNIEELEKRGWNS